MKTLTINSLRLKNFKGAIMMLVGGLGIIINNQEKGE